MTTAYESRMRRVVDYIHRHPDGDLSLDALADVAAMSRFHWHRVFHAMTGETCAQAVRRVRLNRAACWLVQTDWPVADIAARIGYPSLPSFSRVFRDSYGQTPGAFRKSGVTDRPYLNNRTKDLEMYEITIEAVSERRLVGLSHQGPYVEIGSAFERLGAIAASRDLWPQIVGMVGIYLDDPDAIPADQLRSFAGLQLAPGASGPEDLETFDLPECRAARLRWVGPYSGLSGAYRYLFGQWLPACGQEPADQPCYEVYMNSPATTAPVDLITDIFLPLKRR